MNRVKLTVLMPSYNKDKYIQEAIESVLRQLTNFDFKLVVTDDGSTDKTVEIVKNYIEKYPDKVVLLPSIKNQGLLSNIIKAYEYLMTNKSEYFCVLDPDDYYTDNFFLEKAVKYLDNNLGYNIYASNSVIDFGDNHKGFQISENIETCDSTFKDLLEDKAILGHTTGSVFRNDIINKELIRKIKQNVGDYYSEHSFREDDFRNRIHLENSKAHYVNEVIGVYRVTNVGLYQGANALRKVLAKVRAYIDMYYFFEKKYPQFIYLAIKNLKRIESEALKSDLNNFLNYPVEDILQFCKVLNDLGMHNKNDISDIIVKFKPLSKKDKEKTFIKMLFKEIFSIENEYRDDIKTHKIIKILGFKIKFSYLKVLNKRISKYKYIHLMVNNKFNKPFVDFLNRNFDKREHLILCKRWYKEYPFPMGENVVEIKSLNGLNFTNNEKIICHSLFDKELVDYLYKNPDILREKAYWVIWGGDLYEAPRDRRNDSVRENFKGLIYLVDNDKDFYNKFYAQYKGKEYFAPYIFPINLKLLKEIKSSKKDYVQIQINNSCDKSTLEMLDILSKFKEQNIKITTILSYGQLEYKEGIIKKGKEIFGDKFEYLENYMLPNDYAKHLAQNDILILNQNRQQGVGNVLASLFLKAKVYIKKEVSTNNYFNNTGINVYDTENISKESFEEFIENKFSENSKLVVQDLLDECNIAQKWSKVFYENNSYDIKK